MGNTDFKPYGETYLKLDQSQVPTLSYHHERFLHLWLEVVGGDKPGGLSFRSSS